MGERASQGELPLPWHSAPPEHLSSKQEVTLSPCSEWRENSLLLSTSAKGDGYLAPVKVRDRIKFNEHIRNTKLKLKSLWLTG